MYDPVALKKKLHAWYTRKMKKEGVVSGGADIFNEFDVVTG